MINGIGVDIIDVNRIHNLFNKFNNIFLDKILTQIEQNIFHKLSNINIKINYLAKRFAAKEAVVKSLGAGIGVIGWKDITILNDDNGMPLATIDKNKLDRLKITNAIKIHLSISDSSTHAIAFAVATL